MKRIANTLFLAITLSFLTGCAAGAATAGYSLKAQTADNLSSVAEERIVERVKRELCAEFGLEKMESSN